MSAAQTTPARRTGRLPADEAEERSRIGRLVHAVEHEQFGAGTELARLDTVARELFPAHDAQCDRALRQIRALNAPLVAHPDPAVGRAARETLAWCDHYDRHDPLADASVERMAGHGRQAHVHVKAIGGACEYAVSGRQRGRLRRALTSCEQPSLLDGEREP